MKFHHIEQEALFRRDSHNCRRFKYSTMRNCYLLDVVLLATTSLDLASAFGPGGQQGGQHTWQWPGQFPTTTTNTATETPSTAVSYSTLGAPPPGAPSSEALPPSGPETTTPGGPQTTGPVGPETTPEGTATTPLGTETGTSPGSATSGGTTGQASGTSTPNSCGSNAQKVSVQNNSGQTLVVQAGAPWTVGSCGNIASGSTCTFCQTRGSTGGNLQFGYGVATSTGTWIEGEWDTNALPTIDISLIPGYSVPIICTSDSTGATTGFSSSLCQGSGCSNCASGGGTWDGNSCQNPSGASNPNSGSLTNGPCPQFFSSVKGEAYCYPNGTPDLGYGSGWDSVSCTAGPQSGGNSKRDTNDSFFPRDAQGEKSTIVETLEVRNTDIARRHAGAARFGAHAGARAHARSLKNLVA